MLNTPSEAQIVMDIDDIVGGLHLPKDAQTNPIDTTMALAKGAQVIEGVTVAKILTDGDKVTGVETNHDTIKAKKIVVTGGMWSRDLARQVGVVLPLFACGMAVFDISWAMSVCKTQSRTVSALN